jgi:hypothetical protein
MKILLAIWRFQIKDIELSGYADYNQNKLPEFI